MHVREIFTKFEVSKPYSGLMSANIPYYGPVGKAV